jgi:gluconokinase
VGNSPWFIGIDLGTGSCKSIVIDERATVLGFAASEYAGTDVCGKWQEQDPEGLIVAVILSVRNALAQARVAPRDCSGLSLGGALHSVLALDERDNPLTGVITWADGRAVRQSGQVRNSPIAGELYQATGCPVHAMYPLYKIMWLREMQPELFRKASRYVSAKEYVFARLTGEYLVDYCVAAGTGLLNTHTLRWNAMSLELAGIRQEQLSLLSAPLAAVHGLKSELANELGVHPSTPVVLGSSDATNSSLGTGAVLSWQATCMVGTSGALRVISSRPVLDERARSWCYAIDEKHWLVGGAINNGGVALSWFRDCLNQAFPNLPPERNLSFEDVLALARQADAGAAGVFCLPFFAGERAPNWHPNARAAFFGLTLEHGAAHLARALLEAVAYRMRSLNEVLSEIGFDPRQIIASGGFTKSRLWLQVVADVLNRELLIPRWGESSAVGAAFWPILSAGEGLALEDLGNLVEMDGAFQPNAEHALLYDRLYPFYLKLYGALEGTFDEAAEMVNHLSGQPRQGFLKNQRA